MSNPIRLPNRAVDIAPAESPRVPGTQEVVYRHGEVETVPATGAGSWIHGYVVSGSVRLEVDDRDWLCGPGDSIALDGLLAHRVAGVSRRPARVVWFSMP
jgi:mannose-6-phosphate isomerase-like protein (cupin superfamily)